MPTDKPDNALIEKPGKGWRAEAYRKIKAERVDFLEQVTNYSLLGADEAKLAAFFGVDREMWLYWLKHSRELRDAVDAGGVMADAEVAGAMKRRATGYEYTRQKLTIDKQGNGHVHDLTEHVPPDTAAGKFWLTNRAGNRWRDKQDHEHSGEMVVDQNITIEFVGVKETKLLDVTPREPTAT